MPKYQSKQSPAPLVSSVSTQLKKTVATATANNPISDEELVEKKKRLLGVIDDATEQFIQNLVDKKVELTSSLDLERLVRLTLLLSGEADSITGSSGQQTETTTTIGSPAEISMSKVEEILNLDDPEVKAMFNKLYNGYNEVNNKTE